MLKPHWICKGKNKRPFLLAFIIFIIFSLFLILFVFSLKIGPYPVKLNELIRFLMGRSINPLCQAALSMRLIRILAAAGAGAGLAVSGAVLQGLFRNPLVDSGLLGINSGAGFGAAIGILFFAASGGSVQIFSLCCALLALGGCFIISSWYPEQTILILVLAGVVISSLFSSLLTLLKFTADPYDKLPRIIYWLMGSFANVEANQVLFIWITLIVGFFFLSLLRWRLNVLSMGKAGAESVGLNVKALTLVAALIASGISAMIISCCGVIGWVGLIVPHLARMIMGNDFKKLLPLSFMLGMLLMVAADSVSRLSQVELPVTILTSFLGVPFYLFLLRRLRFGNGGWCG